MTDERPRIAWWSPLPPSRSGIADYSAELLPYLARAFTIDLVVDGCEPEALIARRHRVLDLSQPDTEFRAGCYDAIIYHVGNSPAHEYIYNGLLETPGLVVLHDLSIAHLVIETTHGRGRTDRLYAELRRQHGDDAAERVRRFFYLGEPAPWDVDPLAEPLNRRVLERAQGVLVHSRFAADRVHEVRADLPVEVVEHHALRPAGLDREHPSDRRPDEVVFCTAGFLTPAKRIDSVLRAMARLKGELRFRYRLVGEVPDSYPLFGMIRDLGLWDQVDLVGRVSKRELYRLVAEADVCINLRHPTTGETSGMVQRVLACGRPVVVSDVGWFSELPDACAVKIPGGEHEDEALALALAKLARDPALRAAMGNAALAYAARLDPESRALAYTAWIRAHVATRGGRFASQLDAELERVAADLGVDGAALGLAEITTGMVGEAAAAHEWGK